jgi:hypothetical protein
LVEEDCRTEEEEWREGGKEVKINASDLWSRKCRYDIKVIRKK